MTPEELAAIRERDAAKFGGRVGAVTATVSEADRRALLAHIDELEARLAELEPWVAKIKARQKASRDRYRAAHPDEHRASSRESMARTRARHSLSAPTGRTG